MGGFLSSLISPLRTRLVDVPMSVQQPPSSAAYERGMRRHLTDKLERAAQFSQTPMSMATMGVLLRKAERQMTGNVSRSIALKWLDGLPRMGRITASTAFVSSRALHMTRSDAIARMEVLQKPDHASLSVMILEKMRTIVKPSITKSGGASLAITMRA